MATTDPILTVAGDEGRWERVDRLSGSTEESQFQG